MADDAEYQEFLKWRETQQQTQPTSTPPEEPKDPIDENPHVALYSPDGAHMRLVPLADLQK